MWKRRLGTVSATFILIVALLAPPAMAVGLETEDVGISVDLGAVVRQALGDLWAWLGAWDYERSGALAEAAISVQDPTAQEALHEGNPEAEAGTPNFGCYGDPNG